MSKRNEHTFEFAALEIAEAAATEAQYHEGRVEHWRGRGEAAVLIVRETIGAKVVERHVTGGTEIDVAVDYGDPEAWREYSLAVRKVRSHTEVAEQMRSDQRVYETQGDRRYELDTTDVFHYRLNGAPRQEDDE